MDSQDKIERELLLPFPREQVWQAWTDPAELAIWFADSAELDLRLGGAALFGWRKEGRNPAIVETVEPPHCFSFRWRSHKSDSHQPIESLPSTLVEITLDEIEEGTRVTLVESGFSGLPDEIRAGALADNASGWDEELQDLRTYFTARPLPAM